MGKVKFVKDVLMDAGGEVADEGLRYLDNSFGALKNLLNRYYSFSDKYFSNVHKK